MRLPKSLLFFVVAGVAYLLQLFPYTGIFLMFLGAPFWSVILVNLGVLGVLGEATSGKVSRDWLVLPVLYFGGYLAYAASERLMLTNLQREVAAANAAARLPFRPDQRALVFKREALADTMVADYNLSIAYTEARRGDKPEFKSARLVDAKVSETLAAFPGLWVLGVTTQPAYIRKTFSPTGYSTSADPKWAVLRQPDNVPLPAITVTSKQDEKAHLSGLPVELTTTTLETPDGQTRELRSGRTSLLRWLPLPVMGCGLNSGAASWDCMFGFMRGQPIPVGMSDLHGLPEAPVLAEALGLARVKPAQRQGLSFETARPMVERAQLLLSQKMNADFETMLADPAADHNTDAIDYMGRQPELITPYLPRMFEAIEAGFESENNGPSAAQRLLRLAHKAPEPDLAAYRPQLATADEQEQAWKDRRYPKPVVRRRD